jgi:hypothetical protein
MHKTAQIDESGAAILITDSGTGYALDGTHAQHTIQITGLTANGRVKLEVMGPAGVLAEMIDTLGDGSVSGMCFVTFGPNSAWAGPVNGGASVTELPAFRTKQIKLTITNGGGSAVCDMTSEPAGTL